MFKPINVITLLITGFLNASAQTNPAASFQGYAVGAVVTVHCQSPLLILNHAMLKEIDVTNIVVESKGDRFLLGRSQTVLSDPPPVAVPVPTGPVKISASLIPGQDNSSTQAGVQHAVLGTFANNPGYAKATTQYQSMMSDLRSWKESLEDITTKAEKILAEVDKYQPERAKDPQFEAQIATLRDFVKRAKAGEQINLAPAD